MSKPRSHVVTIRLDTELKEFLMAMAYEDRRTLSGYINRVLEQHRRDFDSSSSS